MSQFSSFVQSCPILCGPMDYSTPGFLVHYQLLESAQTHVHHVHPTVSSCYSLLLLPSIFSNIDVYFNEPVLSIRWPKSWSFSFSISPSEEYSGLISVRIDWMDLLVVHGTLNCLLQHHSSKASILWRSTFFRVQFSHPYMTTGKIIALTRSLSAKQCLYFLICCLGWS